MRQVPRLVVPRPQRPDLIWTERGPVEVALRGEGPALLCIHGQPGGYDQGLMLATMVGGAMRAIAPSRPGYLGTPLSSGRSVDEQAELMRALLDALGVDQCSVLALSAGAPVALALAARHPHRVRALALVSAVTGPEISPLDRWTRLTMSPASLAVARIGMVMTPRMAALGGLWALGNLPPRALARQARRATTNPSARWWLTQIIRSVDPYGARRPGVENDDDALMALADRLPDGIRAPVLAVHGDRDPQVPEVHARRLLRDVPGAKVLVIPGGTHLLPLHPLWPQAQDRIRALLTPG